MKLFFCPQKLVGTWEEPWGIRIPEFNWAVSAHWPPSLLTVLWVFHSDFERPRKSLAFIHVHGCRGWAQRTVFFCHIHSQLSSFFCCSFSSSLYKYFTDLFGHFYSSCFITGQLGGLCLVLIWLYTLVFRDRSILFFFFLINLLFFYFLTLQYCINFTIYQHESATGIYVFPILNPPPSSLPVPGQFFIFPTGCISSESFCLASSSFSWVSLLDFSSPDRYSLLQSVLHIWLGKSLPLYLTLSFLLSGCCYSCWCCWGSASLAPAPDPPEAPFLFSLLLLCLQAPFCRPAVLYLSTSQFASAFVFSVYLFSLSCPLLSLQSFISLLEL